MESKVYDWVVIGGGSGGIASARRAAAHGASVALIEGRALGGTCVNRGCVPKKMFFNAASIAGAVADAEEYGFAPVKTKLDWRRFRDKRSASIQRLNGIYSRNLSKDGVDVFRGWAKFEDAETLLVEPSEDPAVGAAEAVAGERVVTEATRVRGRHILIAPGGAPTVPDVVGSGLGIVSDEFFELDEQPKKVAIVGAGYIAVELAGVFQELGTNVCLCVRGDRPVRQFDADLGEVLGREMEAQGIDLQTQFDVECVERRDEGLTLTARDGRTVEGLDQVLWAIGRHPATAALCLENAGVTTDAGGHIPTDEFERTNVHHIFAVGDVNGKRELTPVAIAAGRQLADRLFGGRADARLDYENIATVIFSHPPVGTVGLSELEARKRYGDSVRVYTSQFVDTYFSMTEHKQRSFMKIVVQGDDERVVGMHAVGRSADELIQGFAVALKMGARKSDLDATVAIHPTAAEEFVTMR